MNKKLLTIVCSVLFIVGCTSPTQRMAEYALDRGTNQQQDIFMDMSRIARQEILNSSAEDVVKAVENQDTEAAQQVVKDVFDKMNKIDWLHVQWERSRTLIRLGQQYVWSQQGVLDILKKEWDEAEKRSGGEVE